MRPTLPDMWPQPGDVFAFPVPEGPTGVCRVGPEGQPVLFGRITWTTHHVVLCDWALDRPPTLAEALALPVLPLTHHLEYPIRTVGTGVFRATGHLPEGWIFLGRVALTGGEPRALHDEPTGGSYHWSILPYELQWERLYRRGPEVLASRRLALMKAKDRQARAAVARERALAAGDRSEAAETAAAPGGVDLEAWRDRAPAEAIEASRTLLVALEAALARRRTRREKGSALRACVKGFNALDDQHGNFIDTEIAEALVFALSELGQAARLEDAEELVEAVRAF